MICCISVILMCICIQILLVSTSIINLRSENHLKHCQELEKMDQLIGQMVMVNQKLEALVPEQEKPIEELNAIENDSR
jgi:hypothetical protein